ncbi:phiSA1p31-related protein [Streptomyces sp. NPDC094032]|uniref:phiSA1p31-related protein n=1 Tax=Streptomyces sp. NPDC094032 TaxID=3155308 RepID=UPI00332E9D04
MILPQPTRDNRAIEVPLDRITAPLLDALALAYADDPGTIGGLLADLADAVGHRDHLDRDRAPQQREAAAAWADAAREAVEEHLDDAVTRPVRLTARAAHQLAGRLAALALRATGTAYVDRDGDRWVATGQTTPRGEPVIACPAPRTADDAGTGPSHPWTLPAVRAQFGPLTEENTAA